MSGPTPEERRAYGRAEETRRLLYAQAVGASVLIGALEHQLGTLPATPAERALADHLADVARTLLTLREQTARSAWPRGASDCG